MVRWTVHSGVRQFLDIGAGLPVSPELHTIAQDREPGARVLYVDRDPAVTDRFRERFPTRPQGWIGCLQADLHTPGPILESAGRGGGLDLAEPVAVVLGGVLECLADTSGPGGLVGELMAGLVPGSCLLVTHTTPDFAPSAVAAAVDACWEDGEVFEPRTHQEVSRFFDGLVLTGPGVESVPRWRPDQSGDIPPWKDTEASAYAAVARKPAPATPAPQPPEGGGTA